MIGLIICVVVAMVGSFVCLYTEGSIESRRNRDQYVFARHEGAVC